jgi:SAM-dependent methyltransferase
LFGYFAANPSKLKTTTDMTDMYKRIANYYRYVFPASPVQREFFRRIFQERGAQSVLDVACGTGEQLEAFAEMGLQVYGLELEEAMVEIIRDKSLYREGRITIKPGNMLQAKELFPGPFDAAVCIGNSLVHLKDPHEISEAVRALSDTLAPGGTAIIQIVNYDRILDQKVTSLPTIETQDEDGNPITFERVYDLSGLPDVVQFITTLTVGEERIENSIPLFPLRSNSLLDMAEKADLIKPSLYGGYDFSPFSPQSQGCILVAEKG